MMMDLLDTAEKLFVTDEWMSNGHWAVKKSSLSRIELGDVFDLEAGQYQRTGENWDRVNDASDVADTLQAFAENATIVVEKWFGKNSESTCLMVGVGREGRTLVGAAIDRSYWRAFVASIAPPPQFRFYPSRGAFCRLNDGGEVDAVIMPLDYEVIFTQDGDPAIVVT